MGIFPSHDAWTWMGAHADPAEPHVLRDEWLGQTVAFVYVPRHLLRAAILSASIAVLRDLAPLMQRPYGEVVSAWGSTTWLISRDQAPQLLTDLGLAAKLIDRVLTEMDYLLEPVRRG